MERSYPMYVLIGFAVVTAVALVGAASVSGTAFGAYNPAWDGTSELRSIAERSETDVTIVQEVTEYRRLDANGTVGVILAPDQAYERSEIRALDSFVRRGGTVVVAGDFGGASNQVLAELDSGIRLNGSLLRDERVHSRSPALPQAPNLTQHPYTDGVEQLGLNYATVLDLQEPNATLVRSSSYSYLDTNRNGDLDDNETLARYPVVGIEEMDDGQLLVVSDPSLFINSMIDEAGNEQFVLNVLDGHDRLAVDVSHSGGLPPAAWVAVTIRNSPGLQVLGGIGLIALVVGRSRIGSGGRTLLDRVTRPQPEPPTFDRATVVESLQQRHPDWDSERVERVAKSLINGEMDSPNDD